MSKPAGWFNSISFSNQASCLWIRKHNRFSGAFGAFYYGLLLYLLQLHISEQAHRSNLTFWQALLDFKDPNRVNSLGIGLVLGLIFLACMILFFQKPEPGER